MTFPFFFDSFSYLLKIEFRRAVDIYLDASRLGIYPPLFTSPSGDSCILTKDLGRLEILLLSKPKYGNKMSYFRTVKTGLLGLFRFFFLNRR